MEALENITASGSGLVRFSAKGESGSTARRYRFPLLNNQSLLLLFSVGSAKVVNGVLQILHGCEPEVIYCLLKAAMRLGQEGYALAMAVRLPRDRLRSTETDARSERDVFALVRCHGLARD